MAEAVGSKTLRELSRAIFTRFGMVLAIIVLITGGALAACLMAEKHYRSSVTFLVKEPRPQNPTAQQVSTDRSLQVFIKTQHELITSQTVSARTLAILNWPDSPVVKNWRSARQTLEHQDTKENRETFHKALSELDQDIEKQTNDPSSTFRDQIRRFAKLVKVETPGGEADDLSEVFTATVVQPGAPQNAQKAADLLSKNYIDRYREVQERSSFNAAEFVRAWRDKLRNERLTPAEEALRKFVREELESPSDLVILEQLGRSGTEAGRQIIVRRFQEERISNEAELEESRQLKQQLLEQLPLALWDGERGRDEKVNLTVPDISKLDEKQLPDDDAMLTDDIVTIIPEATLKNNVVVAKLKTQEVDLLVNLNRLRVEYNPDYREVRDKTMEIARTRRQILRELVGEAKVLDIKIATLEARQREIERSLDEELKHLNKITLQLVRYQELQNEVMLARDEYRKISADLAGALNFQEQEANAITINIVDPANLPDAKRPAYPRPTLYTLIAACVGILLGGAYAFVADHFDHTLHSIEAAERYLGVPVLGSVRKCGRRLLK